MCSGRVLFCAVSSQSLAGEKSKKIVSFTNQPDETSPSRTPVITSSPAGQQGGPCSSLIAGQSWLLHSPLSPLRPLEIAGPTLLLCSARWTPTGTLWVSIAACHIEKSGQWYNPSWGLGGDPLKVTESVIQAGYGLSWWAGVSIFDACVKTSNMDMPDSSSHTQIGAHQSQGKLTIDTPQSENKDVDLTSVLQICFLFFFLAHSDYYTNLMIVCKELSRMLTESLERLCCVFSNDWNRRARHTAT